MNLPIAVSRDKSLRRLTFIIDTANYNLALLLKREKAEAVFDDNKKRFFCIL